MKIIFFNNKNKIKNISILTLFFLILFVILIFSNTVHKSVNLSVKILLTSLIPSLLPFLILAEFAMNTNILNMISKVFGNFLSKVFKLPKCSSIAIIIGFLCGFPSGAKAVNMLYQKNMINKNQAYHLLAFVNNNNPAFIISAIGISVFNSIQIGFLLLFSHFIASVLIGIFYINPTSNIIHEFTENSNNNYVENTENIVEILKKCIFNAFKTLGIIFGFVTIFNLGFDLLNMIFIELKIKANFVYIISALVEITRGSYNIANLSFDIKTIICVESFMLGFSGICIILQIYSTISKNNFSFLRLLKYKLNHGILSAIITYILLKYTNVINVASIPILNSIGNIKNYSGYKDIIYKSYIYSFSIILFAIFIYIITNSIWQRSKFKNLQSKKEK